MTIGIFGKSKSGKTTLSKTLGCTVLHTDDYAYLGWGNCCDRILNDWEMIKGDKAIEGIILPRLLNRGLKLDKIILCVSDRVNEKSVSLDNMMMDRFNKLGLKFEVFKS